MGLLETLLIFALVFGIAALLLYVASDLARLPLFTFHPGTGRIDFGWVPARELRGQEKERGLFALPHSWGSRARRSAHWMPWE